MSGEGDWVRELAKCKFFMTPLSSTFYLGGAGELKSILGKPSGKKSGNLGNNDGPILHVDLIKGRNLIKSDLIGKSDPYAVLKYGDQQDKTKVVKNSLNPQWDHGSDFDMDLGDNTPLM